MRATQQSGDALRQRMWICSQRRIEEAAQQEAGFGAQAACRVLESPAAQRDWSISHNRLLTPIAMQRRTPAQIQAVKRMALSVIHRKAPFEFLRDRQLRGAIRHAFFTSLYGEGRDYARAMVREHRGYLSAVCSYVCLDTLCGPGSLHRILAYERCYQSFWQAQAALRLGVEHVDRDAMLVDYLRRAARAARQRLLDASPGPADEKTMEELRRPVGDTVRLRRPSFEHALHAETGLFVR